MLKIANLSIYFKGIRRICLIVFFGGFIFTDLYPYPLRAQVQDVYLVTNIAVDRTAKTAAKARQKAINDGHKRAFVGLMDRLVPESQRDQIPNIQRSEINFLIRSFGIDEERRSTVRYLGKLRFEFSRSEVRRFLKKWGVNFAETRSKPLLLLPVYKRAGATLLWDKPNPWFAAWRSGPVMDGLRPLRLPAGDLSDIRDISAAKALAGDAGQLRHIAERYGASGVVVALASLTNNIGSGERSIVTVLKYFGNASRDSTTFQSFDFSEDEVINSALSRVANNLSRQIVENWKRANLIQFDRLNTLIAEVALTHIREWVKMRARLRRIAFLKDYQILSVSRGKVLVKLLFYGDPSQLKIALEQRDIEIKRGIKNWILRDLKEAKVVPANRQPDEGIQR
ncbi:MAG: DUF2066 domain-containing protein [Pseudomonadota bacterium]|nr:DUF2066 domain-containing protein [Pseudomonadota bacterium]